MKLSLPVRSATTLLLGAAIALSAGAFHAGQAAADDFPLPASSRFAPTLVNVQLTQSAGGITATLTYRNNSDEAADQPEGAYHVLYSSSASQMGAEIWATDYFNLGSYKTVPTPSVGQTSTATVTEVGLGKTQCFTLATDAGDFSNGMCATFSNATNVAAPGGCLACQADTGLKNPTNVSSPTDCPTCGANIGNVPNRLGSTCDTPTCVNLPFQGTVNGQATVPPAK